jgi:hypothetical protein
MNTAELINSIDEVAEFTQQLLHDEIERNKQEQANRNRPNYEYLKAMGLLQ